MDTNYGKLDFSKVSREIEIEKRMQIIWIFFSPKNSRRTENVIRIQIKEKLCVFKEPHVSGIFVWIQNIYKMIISQRSTRQKDNYMDTDKVKKVFLKEPRKRGITL